MILVIVATGTVVLGACQHKDACEKLQERVDALPAAGGTVVIEEGTYECGETLVIARSNVTVQGSGENTILRLQDGVNAPVVIIGSNAPTPERETSSVRLTNLVIDGNRQKQSYECHKSDRCEGRDVLRNNGISVRRGTDNLVQDVRVERARSGGLVSELGSRRVTVRNFVSSDNEFDGLAATETEESTFSDLRLSNNKAAGLSFDVRFNGNQIRNAVLDDNGTVGLFMREAARNTFDQMIIRRSKEHGVFLAQVDNDATRTPTGNVFRDLTIEDSGGAGFRVNDQSARGNTLTRARISGHRLGCVSEPVDGLVSKVDVTC